MKSVYTTQELELSLGESLRSLRLQKNLDQKTLCAQAGLSLTALKNLESGRGASVKTLLRVARALGRSDWILAVAPQVSINPLHMLRTSSPRQRAGRRPKKKSRDVLK